MFQLTPREKDILCLMVQGFTNQQIADNLFLTRDAVRSRVRDINNKLGTPKQETSTATRQATIDIALRHNLCAEANTESDTPNNLPHETTTFIGRTQELSDLSDLLAVPSNRLISIVASGGMGKTRLALALAHRQLPNFKDGVFFVPLQAVATEQGLINEIGSRMGILFQSDSQTSPLQQLLSILKDKQRLLVLDNFEQLLDHVHIINEILKHAPQVKMVITSRERLKLKGEVVYRLMGLSENTEAIDLFIDGLQRIQPDITLDENDIDTINQICQLVEGLPLALILAGNWIEVLSLPEIADEITESLDLLSEDMGDAEGIRAIFDRTWTRLTPAQQNVFMKLSVFVGDFTRESAKAITNASIITLKQLADKSLIRQIDNGRYDMHELLRQYASEQLDISSLADETIDSYIAYFSNFVSSREQDVKGANQLQALAEIEAEFPNIEHVWYETVARQKGEPLIPMLECLYFATEYLNLLHIHVTMLIHAHTNLAHLTTNPFTRLNCLLEQYIEERRTTLGYAPSPQINQDTVNHWLEVARQTGHSHDIGLALLHLGGWEFDRKQYTEAIEIYLEVANQFTQTNDLCRITICYERIATCYWVLGQADQDDYYIQLCVESATTLGNDFLRFQQLANHASTLARKTRFDEAYAIYESMLTIAHQLNHPLLEARAYHYLATNTWRRGYLRKAETFAEKEMELSQELGLAVPLGLAYRTVAIIATLNNDFDKGRKHAEKAYELLLPTQNFFANTSLKFLSLALCGQQQFKQAKTTLKDIIVQGSQHRVANLNLAICVNVALIEAHIGNPITAVEMLGLALTHPLSVKGWIENWDLITDLRNDLKTKLGEELYNQAWQRGTQLDPDEVINWMVEWVNKS